MFGPYRLVAPIGRGGMGEVSRAVDTSQGDRVVALKVLGSWLAGDEDYARRFRRESALIARLTSPHIVPIHRYGEIDGRLFIDMPLIDGDDLGTLLRREGPLPAPRAVGIIGQVAHALSAAHRAGLLHRDIKPSNILITDKDGEDHAYLIDFGMSRSVDEDSVSSASRAMIGTLAYTAPERFAGVETHAGDVYALGCVLHESLTGAPPFPAHGALALMNAHQNAAVPPTSMRAADVPDAIDAVVARAMAKDPRLRYSSALGLAAAARQAMTSGGPSGTSSGAAVRPVGISTAATPRPAPVGGPGDGSPRTPAHRAERRGRTAGSVRRYTRRGIILAGVATAATITGMAITAWPGPGPGPVKLKTLTGHRAPVLAMTAATVDGRQVLVSASEDGNLQAWDPVENSVVLDTDATVLESTGGFDAAEFSLTVGRHSGVPVVVRADPATMEITNFWTGEYLSAVSSGSGGTGPDPVTTAQVGDRIVVVQGVGSGVRVFDARSAADVSATTLPAPVNATCVGVAQVAGRPPAVISGGDNGRVIVSELLTGRVLAPSLGRHEDLVNCVATAQVGDRPVVVSGSSDNSVRMWDLDTGEPVGRPMLGHVSGVNTVVTAEVGGRPVAVSGGFDSIIRIWDLTTGEPAGEPLLGHSETIQALAVAHVDGRPLLASAGGDNTIVIWDLDNAVRT